MSRESHAIRRELSGVILFIAAIWAVFLASLFFPGVDQYGVVPRRLIGLVGIPAMPFLHANLQHILSNTIPLFILLILLAGSRAASWEVVVFVSLLGGLLLWIFGREAVHIGASGLISGLTAFLDPFWISGETAHTAFDRADRGVLLRWLAHPRGSSPLRFADLLGRSPLRRTRWRGRGSGACTRIAHPHAKESGAAL